MIQFKDAIVLITGGTGSFGVAFLVRLIALKTKEIRVFSRDEKKQFDLKRQFPQKNIRWFIGDVRDRDSLRDAMRGANLIFHAAALKQVPTLQSFPVEATKTNILGTDNVLSLAIDYHVDRVIVLSTDKSIQPISVMGMTKFLMEKVALAKAADVKQPIINIVRYGNVIASRGSVIPLFIDAMKQHKPIQVHQLTSTRFMIKMGEAIDLVFAAANQGKPGEIFVPRAKSASLKLIVRALERMLKVNAIVEETAPRPGDKLHETIIDADEYEYTIATKHYFVVDGLKKKKILSPIKPFSSEIAMMTLEEIMNLLQSEIH